MWKKSFPALLAIALSANTLAKTPAPPPVPAADDAWRAKVEAQAPKSPRVKPAGPRKILVTSLATGFCHDVIPHVKIVMETLAKTGAFEVTFSDDLAMYEADKLAGFDAVLLNNTCTKNPTRNWFLDVLANDASLSPEQRQQKAVQLEKNLIDFVAGGKGLVAVHGAIVFLNESPDFGKVMGGSFEMHPKLQPITLLLVEPEHPLSKAFAGKSFTHLDEPYLFHKEYTNKNFRPLLEIDVPQLEADAKAKLAGDRRYVSWIKAHGKGRVFYVSPSHRPETYERAEMLQFYLDGIQYALGDLKVDDAAKAK
jgi:type 1 glutamine amidotransferase